MKPILFLMFLGLIFSLLLIVDSSINISADENFIPSWIKNTAKFWAEEKISDSEFLSAIQFLLDNGILKSESNLTDSELSDKIRELELENQKLKNRITDLEYRHSSDYITYSIDEIPLYADSEMIEEAITRAFHHWERLNPELDYVQVEKGGDISIEFLKEPLLGEDYGVLGYVDSISCFDNCVITIVVGDKDCNSIWSQFTIESTQEIVMHEIGHTIGLEHTGIYPHIMYSEGSSVNVSNDLGYTLPTNVQEDIIVINKAKLYTQIDETYEKIQDILKPYGVTIEELISGEKISNSNVFRMEADQKVIPLIEEYNSMIEEINCFQVHDKGVD